MHRGSCVLVLMMVSLCLPVAAWAVKHPPSTGPVRVEEDCFSFGAVVAVKAGSVTIREYDFVKDTAVNRTYHAAAETEYGNIDTLADLKPGDDVVIDYVVKSKKRIMTTLVKEEKGLEPVTKSKQGKG